MSCDSKVISDYPDQPPPQAWRSSYSEPVEFDVKSVFDLPLIPLTEITPQQSTVWTVGLMQPGLIPEIPYHVNLARVVDVQTSPHAINFSSPSHGAVTVMLSGQVNGDKLRAQGLAQLGAGMLRSQKHGELALTRHK